MGNVMELISKSAQETKKVGTDFVKKLSVGIAPVTIGLIGDLGSGKTTFVQGMARGLGIDPRTYVNSPTFTLVNEYKNLIHVDLYRTDKPEEIDTLALEEYMQEGNVIVIEWVEKDPLLEKKMDFLVRFEMISEKERRIRYDL